MADAFAPTAGFDVAMEQPVGGVENRAAEVAVRGVSGLFESLARTKSAGASDNLDPLRRDFITQLNMIEAQRAQGHHTKADLNWARLRNNYAMAGGDYQDGFGQVIESVTGRSLDFDIVDPTQRAIEQTMESPEYQTAILSATLTNPNGSREEWEAQALQDVAELQHSAHVVARVQAGEQLSWETQVRGAYHGVINSFKQGTIASLMQITNAGGTLGPTEVAQAKLVWDQTKSAGLSRPANVTDAQWQGIQSEIDNIEGMFESMTKLSSSELAMENLKSLWMSQVITGDGTELTQEQTLGVMLMDRDPTAYAANAGVNLAEVFTSLAKRTEAGRRKEADARLSDTLTQTIPVNSGGAIDNHIVTEIPEEFSGYADMSMSELTDNLTGDAALIEAIGIQSINAGQGANEDLRDAYMSAGTAMMQAKGFFSAGMMSSIFGDTAGLNQKLDALAGISAKDAREARVMLRSGLDSQIRMLTESESSLMSGLNLAYDEQRGQYYSTLSGPDAAALSPDLPMFDYVNGRYYVNPRNKGSGSSKFKDLLDRRAALNVAERAFEDLKVEDPTQDDVGAAVDREMVESAVAETLADGKIAKAALLALQQSTEPLTGPVSDAQQRDVEPAGEPVSPPPEVEAGEIPEAGPGVSTEVNQPQLTGESEIGELVGVAGVQADLVRQGWQDDEDKIADKLRSRQRVQELLTPQQIDKVIEVGYDPERIEYFPSEEAAEEALSKGEVAPNTLWVDDNANVYLLEEATEETQKSTLPPQLISHVKQWEGLELEAYQDQAGIWTIGYGHTRGVKRGDKVTKEQALKFLEEDFKDASSAVDSYVKVPLDESQRSALISFVFNVGAGAFRSSTMLRKLNAGDSQGAAEEFARWKFVTDPKTGEKVVSNGLVNRRASERDLFLGG